ncbi:MAG: GNAT family N-acetyltransferase, partial [Candidatus Dormibacteraceae bacterium]
MTTWYLEQTSPQKLRSAPLPSDPVMIKRAEIPSPEFSRFLYTAVGGYWYWTKKLGWSWQQWTEWLARPGVETWVAWLRGTPAGYVELEAQPAGQVEVTCFGLLSAFIGRGIGKFLLTNGLARAWDLAERWAEQERTERVWLHTCSLDSSQALANYQARGLRIYDTRVKTKEVTSEPSGPWPGANKP